MNDDPLLSIIVIGLAAYVFHIWFSDFKAHRKGEPHPKALPGAFPASWKPVIIGIAGAFALVGIETLGEYRLDVVSEQSTVSWLFLLVSISAGFIEELVFRGYLVVRGRGVFLRVSAIVLFSALFALGHVQYYLDWAEDAAWHEFTFSITAKSSWTLLLLFLNSLWFYTLRFLPSNPERSLIPCFAAHIASNIAVFLVKLAQGHVSGLY